MVKFEPRIKKLSITLKEKIEGGKEKKGKALIKGKNCGRKVKRKMKMKKIKGKKEKGKEEKKGIGGKKKKGKKGKGRGGKRERGRKRRGGNEGPIGED